MPVSPVMGKDEGDLAECVEPKLFRDVVGYYNGFDIFKLRIDFSRARPATFDERSKSPGRDLAVCRRRPTPAR